MLTILNVDHHNFRAFAAVAGHLVQLVPSRALSSWSTNIWLDCHNRTWSTVRGALVTTVAMVAKILDRMIGSLSTAASPQRSRMVSIYRRTAIAISRTPQLVLNCTDMWTWQWTIQLRWRQLWLTRVQSVLALMPVTNHLSSMTTVSSTNQHVATSQTIWITPFYLLAMALCTVKIIG